MNPQTISTALKDIIAADMNVEVFDYVPDNPSPPCLVIYPESFPYSTTDGMRWIVLCLVGTSDIGSGQEQLWRWLSDDDAESIIAALDANNTLGGVVSSVLPVEFRNWTTVNLADGRRLLQAELVLDVLR